MVHTIIYPKLSFISYVKSTQNVSGFNYEFLSKFQHGTKLSLVLLTCWDWGFQWGFCSIQWDVYFDVKLNLISYKNFSFKHNVGGLLDKWLHILRLSLVSIGLSLRQNNFPSKFCVISKKRRWMDPGYVCYQINGDLKATKRWNTTSQGWLWWKL